MAHFAELDDNNLVLRVLVVPNEQEHRGQEFLADDLGLGGRWIQTSYNGNIRGRFAGPGYTYDPTVDVFIASQPAPWYVLNDDYEWIVPIGVKPQNGEIVTDREWQWLEVVFAVSPHYPLEV
jgi:hypothetical protein